MGPDVASVAVVTKLLRVCMLEPWLLFLFYFGPNGALRKSKSSSGSKGRRSPAGPRVPWFALGFFAVAAFNSTVGFAPEVSRAAALVSAIFLASAMAALGLDADLGEIRKLGPKPVILAAALWLNLLVGGLVASNAVLSIFP
eukprot:scaffold301117_cov30-Tisochrysis_lutea.AAC.3